MPERHVFMCGLPFSDMNPSLLVPVWLCPPRVSDPSAFAFCRTAKNGWIAAPAAVEPIAVNPFGFFFGGPPPPRELREDPGVGAMCVTEKTGSSTKASWSVSAHNWMKMTCRRNSLFLIAGRREAE
jgi:hypothetical protein